MHAEVPAVARGGKLIFLKHARISKGGMARLTCNVLQVFATLLIAAGSTFAAILDTGCTATVAGAEFVRRYVSKIQQMDTGRDLMSWVSYGVSNLEFTTGSGKVRAKRLVTLPINHGGDWCTLEVHEVPGTLPLLISLGTMRQMGIVMDLPKFLIRFRDMWYRIVERDGLIIMPMLEWPGFLQAIDSGVYIAAGTRKVLEDDERRGESSRGVRMDGENSARSREVRMDGERRSFYPNDDGKNLKLEKFGFNMMSDEQFPRREALSDDERRNFGRMDGSPNAEMRILQGDARYGKGSSEVLGDDGRPAIALRTVGASPDVEASDEPPAIDVAISRRSATAVDGSRGSAKNDTKPQLKQSAQPTDAGVRGDELTPALTETEILQLRELNLDDTQSLAKLHRQFGHRRALRILQVLKSAGFSDLQLANVQAKLCEIEQACAVCQAESRPGNQPKVSLPHALFPNHIMLADLTETNDGLIWLHLLDQFSTKSVAGLCKNKTPEVFISIFTIRWVSWTGFPKFFYADIEGSFGSAKFVGFLTDGNCIPQLGPSEAKFAHGQIERHNALIKDIYHALMAENPKRDPETAMALATATKCELPTVDGKSADELYLGQRANLPYPWDSSTATISRLSRDMQRTDKWVQHQSFTLQLQQARQAAMQAQLQRRLRELDRHHVPGYKDDQALQIGEMVSFWRDGTAKSEKGYYGPAKVLGVDDSWVVLRNEREVG